MGKKKDVNGFKYRRQGSIDDENFLMLGHGIGTIKEAVEDSKVDLTETNTELNAIKNAVDNMEVSVELGDINLDLEETNSKLNDINISLQDYLTNLKKKLDDFDNSIEILNNDIEDIKNSINELKNGDIKIFTFNTSSIANFKVTFITDINASTITFFGGRNNGSGVYVGSYRHDNKLFEFSESTTLIIGITLNDDIITLSTIYNTNYIIFITCGIKNIEIEED